MSKSDIIGVLSQEPGLLNQLPDWQGNREVVLEAVKHDGRALRLASDELRDNKKIVSVAVQCAPVLPPFSFNIDRSPEDRCRWIGVPYTVIIEQGQHPALSHFLDIRDGKLVLKQSNELALKYASKRLRNDIDVVLAAVKKNWQAIQFASDELKKDEKVIRFSKIELAIQNELKKKARISEDRARGQYAIALEAIKNTAVYAGEDGWQIKIEGR